VSQIPVEGSTGIQGGVGPLPKDCERALNFLMGQVMKETQGRANPQIVRRLLLERLDAE
jgi:Asp-tRNA(Asn)/Glu-tRNA(Gln) amidotransferase B subunit